MWSLDLFVPFPNIYGHSKHISFVLLFIFTFTVLPDFSGTVTKPLFLKYRAWPTWGNSVATMKFLKVHFEGSATYRKLASDKKKNWSPGMIYFWHVSLLSTSAGISCFLPLFGEEEKWLFVFVLVSGEHGVFDKLIPNSCAARSLLHFPVCCLNSLEPFGNGSRLHWTLCRSGYISWKAPFRFYGNHCMAGKGWGSMEPLVL